MRSWVWVPRGPVVETETPGVSRHHVEPWVDRARLASKKSRRLDDLWQQLDGVDVQLRVFCRRTGGDPRAEAQEQRARRRGVQQQRKPCLPGVDTKRGAAPLLLAVVDAQARNAVCVHDHAHGGHDALPVADDAAALRDVDERQRRRQGW